MARILLSCSFPNQPILRQIPRAERRWCTHEFRIDSHNEPVDGWVIYDNLREMQSERCDREQTLLVTGEPPSLRTYHSRFCSQFGGVITSHSRVRHRNVQHAQESQPWHYGLHPSQSHARVLDYDSIAALVPPKKTKLLSVIASNKVVTEDHRQRLAFVQVLKEHFGDQIDIFGRGIRDLDDKADAIWNYRYHVVLENDHSEHYMSEKLPDSFLGWSFPFYHGGPHATRVFPAASFIPLDIYRPTESIARMRQAIDHATSERAIPALMEARRIVLDEINLFSVLCRYYDRRLSSRNTEQRLATSSPSRIGLYPKNRAVRLTLHRWLRSLSLQAS